MLPRYWTAPAAPSGRATSASSTSPASSATPVSSVQNHYPVRIISAPSTHCTVRAKIQLVKIAQTDQYQIYKNSSFVWKVHLTQTIMHSEQNRMKQQIFVPRWWSKKRSLGPNHRPHPLGNLSPWDLHPLHEDLREYVWSRWPQVLRRAVRHLGAVLLWVEGRKAEDLTPARKLRWAFQVSI